MFGGSQVAVVRNSSMFYTTAAAQQPNQNMVANVPLSYAAAAAQPANLNKVATEKPERGPMGKWPHVDAGKKTVLLTRCVSQGQDDRDRSTVTVTFKALLSQELMIPNTRLGIVFGPPLSGWQELLVDMREEAPAVNIEDGTYRLMVGDLCFPQQLVGKTIPYKYVAVDPGGCAIFEYIHAHFDGKSNRCLIVPDFNVGFTKYDDVILSEGWAFKLERLHRGRFLATYYMLPSLTELANPQFDFASALDQFEAVVRAHGPDQTKVCIDNRSHRYTFDALYKATAPVDSYVGDLIKILRKAVNNNSCEGGKVLRSTLNNSNCDKGTLLRSVIYICLIAASKCYSYRLSSGDHLLIYEAFFACTDELQQGSAVLPAVEVRKQVCDALKELVKKFVPLYQTATVNDQKKRGNWIAAVPFIHCWDPVDVRDSDWLDLTDWKRQNQFR